MNTLTLLGDRIIARLITPDKSDGGILLPECAGNTASHRLAEVLHVGPGLKTKKGETILPDVFPGEKVVLDFNGGWIKLDDELLILSTARNVLAVLEKEAENV